MVFQSRGNRRGFVTLAAIAFAVFTLHSTRAEIRNGRVDNSWDIAVIDRALATVKPGQDVVVFGDFGMRPDDLRAFRDRLVAQQEGVEPEAVTPPGTAFKWPFGIVNYQFDPAQVSSGAINAAKMQAFRDGVAEWAAFANLTFTEFTGTPPTNYITVQDDSSRNGGFSNSIGMLGGPQLIQIGSTSWNRGTICHEVGHSLGLYHEQQRSDRDTYVTILSANIIPGTEGNFTKLPDPPGGSTNVGAYDFYSIMHYERNALSVDPPNKDTIAMNCPNPPTVCYSQYLNIIGRVSDRILSKLDRAGMAAIYGPPALAPSATVINRNDSGPGSLRAALYFAFDRSTDPVPTPTSIVFNITGAPVGNVFTIKPSYPLVAPGANTTIDGNTQTVFSGDTNPSGPEVVIDGSTIAQQNLINWGAGFILRETGCTIKNLVINRSRQQGIVFDGGTAAINGTFPSGNVISGCYIGTDETGTIGVGNGSGWPGIELFGGSHNNTIGGLTSAARNIISGNTHHGVIIQSAGSNNNLIVGNYLGTNAAGTGALSNTFCGVAIYGGAQNNTVGGLTTSARNVISGNGRQGIIFADSGTNGNSALGNFVGTNAAGTGAIPNGQSSNWAGVAIFNGAKNNIVGGTAAGANTLSGNTAQGLLIADAGTTGNLVLGNFIGTNYTGTAPLPNQWAGIAIFGGAQSNTVGGLTSAARNIISGNSNQGMIITDAGTNLNSVQGNFIGTDVNGTAALPNQWAGISIFGSAQSNTIGGSVPGARNIISGNLNQGIAISAAATASNVVQGNFIGLDITGMNAIANKYSAIEIFGGSHNNTIGGTTGEARNYLSGNTNYGIAISASGTNNNLVQGNSIGVNLAGTIVPNGRQGVAIFGGAQSNTVGGTTGGASNIIVGNTNEGVATFDATTSKNTISENSIFSNHTRGIGVYTNSNNNQAAPAVTAATLSSVANPNGTDISGTLNSTASTTFRIEFFASPGGTDEGKNFIGSTNAVADGSGAAAFGPVQLAAAVPIAPVQPGGSVITATATDPNGNTSQFSAPVAVMGTTDSDGDGIPDNWMIAHFNHALPLAGEHANEDYDGDGLTNLQEFLAGTDPKSGGSWLHITAIARSGTDRLVTFASVAGKTYRVDYKDDITSANWILLQDQLSATASSTQITDTGAGNLTHRFYRVALEP